MYITPDLKIDQSQNIFGSLAFDLVKSKEKQTGIEKKEAGESIDNFMELPYIDGAYKDIRFNEFRKDIMVLATFFDNSGAQTFREGMLYINTDGEIKFE